MALASLPAPIIIRRAAVAGRAGMAEMLVVLLAQARLFSMEQSRWRERQPASAFLIKPFSIHLTHLALR
jgi:hypothetical protein